MSDRCHYVIAGTKADPRVRPCRNRTTDPRGLCRIHQQHVAAGAERAASMPRPPHTHECMCSVCSFPDRRHGDRRHAA